MAKGYLEIRDFTPGLNDKANEDGLGLDEGFSTFSNTRTSSGVAEARPRMARVASCDTDTHALTLNGTNQYVSFDVDTRVWTLGTKFTLSGVFIVSDKTAANTFAYVGVTTPSIVVDTNSSKVRVRFWDSSATLTTVTSTDDCPQAAAFSFQVVRDGSSLSLRIDNGTADTESLSATNLSRAPVGEGRVGRDSGSNYTGGTWDVLRLMATAESGDSNRLVRHPNPRSESVLADYDCRLATGSVVKDRSRFENHAQANNSPSETTALSHSHAMAQSAHPWRDDDNRQRVLIVAGGRIHDVEL